MNGSLGIVIATYNRVALVRRAVESVLAQNERALDLVVVDDGSDEDVQSALAGIPLARVLRQPNLGVGAARNHGLRESRADWVLVFDDDDTLLPGALAAIRAALSTLHEAERFPAVLFGSSNSRQDVPFARLRPADYLERRVGGDLIPVLQRDLFLEEGLAYPDTRVGGEHLLWLEIARRYGIPSWNSVILQVSSDDRERLSSAETQVRRASEHALLQEETLARFGQLFRDSYPEEYRRRRLGAAAYRLLAGDRAAAREHLRESGLPRRDRRRLGLTLLSFLPHSLTRRAFVRFRREHRRV